MRIRSVLTVALFLGMIAVNPLKAQEEATTTSDNDFKYNRWSVYLGGGWFQYYGDIARAHFYPGNSTTKEGGFSWNVMGGANYWFNPYFGFNANLAYARLATQKQEKYNVYLENTTIFYDVNAVASLSNLLFPRDYEKRWKSYISFGVGNAHYRSLLRNLDDTYIGSHGYENSKNPAATEPGATDGMKSEATWKLASGFKYKLTKRLAVGIEASLVSLPTDHFDVVNRVLTEKDKIGYTNLMVQYTFGKHEMHNEWNPVDPTMAELLKRIKDVEKDVDDLKKDLDDVKDDVDVLMKDYDLRTNSPDSDGDGVPDYLDLEPNSPAGATVNFQGVALPIEKDKFQRNPDGSFKFDPQGNPILTEEPKDFQGIALYSVFFPLNSTYLSPANMERISIAANVLKRYPDLKFDVVGSACEIASPDYNDDLSRRRANVVRDVLVKDFGIDSNRLIVSWTGELKPLTSDRRKLFLNRRTDILIAQ
jgi:outer membrane protein OmpA-like peptidoglycan-associated protein